MATTFTSKGSATTDGTTATVSSVSTVNGRLYMVVAAGVSNRGSGTNYYDDLACSTSGGLTVTERVYQRSFDRLTPLAAIFTFVGNGNSQNVTVTQQGGGGD